MYKIFLTNFVGNPPEAVRHEAYSNLNAEDLAQKLQELKQSGYCIENSNLEIELL